MRITVMTEDNTVLVDGSPWPVSCEEFLKKGIACIQVFGDWAEVEYLRGEKPNRKIFDGHPGHKAEWDMINKMLKLWQEREGDQRVKEIKGE